MGLFLLPHNFTGIQLEKASQNEGWGGICWELGANPEAYLQVPEERVVKKWTGKRREYVFFITQLMKGLFPG